MTENIKPLIILIQKILNIKNKISLKIIQQEHTNKQYNPWGSTKTLNRPYSVESMNIKTDNIITNLNLVHTQTHIHIYIYIYLY